MYDIEALKKSEAGKCLTSYIHYLNVFHRFDLTEHKTEQLYEALGVLMAFLEKPHHHVNEVLVVLFPSATSEGVLDSAHAYYEVSTKAQEAYFASYVPLDLDAMADEYDDERMKVHEANQIAYLHEKAIYAHDSYLLKKINEELAERAPNANAKGDDGSFMDDGDRTNFAEEAPATPASPQKSPGRPISGDL